MIATDPVGIRQVDTDRGSRITVSTQHGYCNHLGTYTLYLGLLETVINRRMVLKPLGILADDLGTFGRLLVDEVHG